MIDYTKCYENRPYHNLNHIHQVIGSIRMFQDITTEQHLAIIYHDIVYEPASKMNEVLSAELASKHHPEHAEFLTDAILATKLHKSTGCHDIDIILDADMSILASPTNQYDEYVRNIRKEYSMYSGTEFNTGRRKFLKSFSGFITPEFSVYDRVAFNNIERELRCL